MWPKSNSIRFGHFELDPLRRELRRDGARVPVQPAALRLLLYLVRHRDRAVSREELLREVWPGVHVSQSALSAAVRRLRRALRDRDQDGTVIETVRAYGFRFAPAEVAVHRGGRRAREWRGPSAEASRVLHGATEPWEELPPRRAPRTEEVLACFEPGAARDVELRAELAGVLASLRRYADLAMGILASEPSLERTLERLLELARAEEAALPELRRSRRRSPH